jgi:hypothetical protein
MDEWLDRHLYNGFDQATSGIWRVAAAISSLCQMSGEDKEIA